MNDDDPQTVKRMLFYLYTLDYPDNGIPDIQAGHVATGRSTPPHLQHKSPTTTEDMTGMSANPGTSEDAHFTHESRMMNNVLVYAIAEKYDIPDLKTLAGGKFRSLARSKWPHDDFCALAEAVFSTTPDTDMGLRQIVLELCEKHFQDILQNKDSRVGLLDIPAIGAVVLDAAVRKIGQDKTLLDGAQAKQEELSQARADAWEEKSKVKAELEKVLEEKRDSTSQLDDLFEYSDMADRCRLCHGEIKCSLDRFLSGGSYKVKFRCTRCVANHSLVI